MLNHTPQARKKQTLPNIGNSPIEALIFVPCVKSPCPGKDCGGQCRSCFRNGTENFTCISQSEDGLIRKAIAVFYTMFCILALHDQVHIRVLYKHDRQDWQLAMPAALPNCTIKGHKEMEE